MRSLLWLGTGLLTVLALAALLMGLWLTQYWKNDGPLRETRVVVIPAGTGLRAAARILARQGVNNHPDAFALIVRLMARERDLRAGEYSFPPRVSPREVLAKLTSNDVVPHSVTVPEGWSSRRIVSALEGIPELKGSIGGMPEEGTLLPETYHFVRGESRSRVLERMRRAMVERVAEIWAERDPETPLKSPSEMVILASVIQLEAGHEAEMPRMAGVFVNRLRAGMPLQADATVVFALTKGEKRLERQLLRRDWETDSPYNTYLHVGLPPAPICHPGEAALRAAARHEETTAYYFLADDHGGHIYADTYREHRRNVDASRLRRRK